MWRYQALLPVPDDYIPIDPNSGMTPLMAAPRLAQRIGATNLYHQERRRLPAHAEL